MLLVECLRVAVPLRVQELLGKSATLHANLAAAWAANAVDEIASHGDILQYGGRKGEAAAVFNHLARAVAALASKRGGVRVFGLIWCAEHSPGGAGPTADVVCPHCLAAES